MPPVKSEFVSFARWYIFAVFRPLTFSVLLKDNKFLNMRRTIPYFSP